VVSEQARSGIPGGFLGQASSVHVDSDVKLHKPTEFSFLYDPLDAKRHILETHCSSQGSLLAIGTEETQ